MHAHPHTPTHKHKCTKYTYIHTYKHRYTQVHAHTHTLTDVCMHAPTPHMHATIHSGTCTHSHKHRYTQQHARTHTCIFRLLILVSRSCCEQHETAIAAQGRGRGWGDSWQRLCPSSVTDGLCSAKRLASGINSLSHHPRKRGPHTENAPGQSGRNIHTRRQHFFKRWCFNFVICITGSSGSTLMWLELFLITFPRILNGWYSCLSAIEPSEI